MNLIEKLKEFEDSINEKLKNNRNSIKILSSKDINKGKVEVMKDRKLIRTFEIEAISSREINILENGKIVMTNLFRDDLGKWIYNLYNPVKYLYAFYGSILDGSILTESQVLWAASGFNPNYENARNSGVLVPIKELDDQPKVKGYVGPILEKIDYGKVYLRYETQEIYNMLST